MTETKVLKLTDKYSVTLTQFTHKHYIRNLIDLAARPTIISLKPGDVEGYTHEQAYEHIEGYRTKWNAYQRELYNAQAFLFLGIAWQRAALEREDTATDQEREGLLKIARNLQLGTPNPNDLVDMGALIYSAIELLECPTPLSEIIPWLMKGAGLLDAEAVAEERKSPEGDGERQAIVGSGGGDEGKTTRRRKNADHR